MIEITLALDTGTRTITLNPKRTPLFFLEAMQGAQTTQDWGTIRKAFQRLLKLTDEESEVFTVEDMETVMQAIKEGTTVPNANG